MSSRRSSSSLLTLQCIAVLLVLLCCLICNSNNAICETSNHCDINRQKEQRQQEEIINEQMRNRTLNINKNSSENVGSSNKYFKCQRSFELLSALPQLSKSTASDNCNFVYFSVVNASATVLPPASDEEKNESTILTREIGGFISEPNDIGNNFMKNNENEKEYENRNSEVWRVQLNVTIELAPNIHELLASHVGSPEDYFLRDNSILHETQEGDTRSSNKTNKPKTHHNNNKNKKVHHKKLSEPVLLEEDDP